MAEPAQDQLIILLIFGTAGILALISFIVLFFFLYQRKILILQEERRLKEIEFQRTMLQAQLASQEKERTRIAADLHDSLGSLLWGAKVNASFLEKSLQLTGETLVSHKELISILDQSIQSVRRISWDLTPEAFYLSGLSQSLNKLCERFNGKGAEVDFSENATRFWNDDKALQVFRIIQELITNSIKHSQASRISVRLTWESTILKLNVEDDGIGLNPQINGSGVGWWSIRQRADFLRAKITLGQTPKGNGSSVVVQIPLFDAK